MNLNARIRRLEQRLGPCDTGAISSRDAAVQVVKLLSEMQRGLTAGSDEEVAAIRQGIATV